MSASESPTSPLALTLFGPLTVRVQGAPLARVRSRKGLWLLALLTLRADRPVEREWLAGMLWPDMDQSQAFANLRPVLSELRSALGSEGGRLQTPDRRTLLLDLQDATVDVNLFDAAVAGKRPADLERAVALYQGPLLEGCDEEWVFQERALREQRCLQALQTLAETALAVGDHSSAIAYFQRAADLDPWSDSARRGWMEALARSGDRNAALQVYRDYVHLLKSDPRAAPDEKTSALYSRLRAEIRRQADPLPETTRKEPAPSAVVVGYLPHAPTELVGREDERTDVMARLRRARLVTLAGFGGIGKTRLALEIAAQSVQEFKDGVRLVALESIADGKQVLPQIASVLGVKEESGEPLLKSLIGHLRRKRLLLVLDNCEHLLEASAQAVSALLRECADLRVLATSREALGITGETLWAVPTLAVPNPAHLPQGRATLLRVLMGYDGVQLFVERAQAVDKMFQLTGVNALAVARVCFQLEGIPLALELAAAQIRSVSIEQMATQLQSDLSLLIGGSRLTPARQQTLRATFDWSYALLSPPEQRLLCRLAVFAGGWTLEAAVAVCGEEGIEAGQILDLLVSLVDKSLVAYDARASDREGRYRLLEVVRQYAAERLQHSGDAETIGWRHRDWFLALAQEAEPHLDGQESSVWMHRLEQDHGNLRLALDRWMQEEPQQALQMATSLRMFWHRRGEFTEGREYLEEALAYTPTLPDNAPLRASALNAVGVMAYRQGDHKAARPYYEASLHLRRELGDRRGEAEALNNLANIAHYEGDHATVLAHYTATLEIFRELGKKREIAWSLSGLGNVSRAIGERGQARKYFEESAQLYREVDYGPGLIVALHGLGVLLEDAEEIAAQQALFEESLQISQELGDRHSIACSLYFLGNLMRRKKDFAEAQSLLEECLRLHRAGADLYSIAWALESLGRVAFDQGDFEQAETCVKECLALFQEIRNRHGIAWSLLDYGRLRDGQGEREQAAARCRESLQQFRVLEDWGGAGESLKLLLTVLPDPEPPTLQRVRLWSLIERLHRREAHALSARTQAVCDRQLQAARTALGRNAFEAAWEEGEALAPESLLDAFLAELPLRTG